VKEPRLLVERRVDYRSDYPVLSSQVELRPFNFPFLDEVRYKFSVRNRARITNKKQIGIFKYSPGSKKWKYVGTGFDRGDQSYHTRVISSGTFALMRDIYPPRIYFIRPGSRYLKNVERIIFKITDQGKGVDYESLQVFFNGRKIDCEYDPDRKTVKIHQLAFLRKGRNKLMVGIKDYAGNSSSKSYIIYLK
jgi:hypothetical protein